MYHGSTTTNSRALRSLPCAPFHRSRSARIRTGAPTLPSAPSPGRHGPAVPVEGVEPSRLAAPPIPGGEVRRVFRVEVPPSRPLCHAARHGNMPGAVGEPGFEPGSQAIAHRHALRRGVLFGAVAPTRDAVTNFAIHPAERSGRAFTLGDRAHPAADAATARLRSPPARCHPRRGARGSTPRKVGSVSPCPVPFLRSDRHSGASHGRKPREVRCLLPCLPGLL